MTLVLGIIAWPVNSCAIVSARVRDVLLCCRLADGECGPWTVDAERIAGVILR